MLRSRMVTGILLRNKRCLALESRYYPDIEALWLVTPMEGLMNILEGAGARLDCAITNEKVGGKALNVFKTSSNIAVSKLDNFGIEFSAMLSLAKPPHEHAAVFKRAGGV
jgi:hypothetical protein